MKLVQIGNNLVNLDQIIKIDLESRAILFRDKNEIYLSESDLNSFVTQYNLVDTDYHKKLLELVSEGVLSNPRFMDNEMIKESITRMVKYNNLTEWFKEQTGGKKLKEMKTAELVDSYFLVIEKVKEIEKDQPF